MIFRDYTIIFLYTIDNMASHINHDEYLIFHVLTNVKLTQINVKTYVKGVKLKNFTPTSVIILEVAMDGSFFIATLAMHKRVKIGERSWNQICFLKDIK